MKGERVELFSGQEKGCHGGGGEWLEVQKMREGGDAANAQGKL